MSKIKKKTNSKNNNSPSFIKIIFFATLIAAGAIYYLSSDAVIANQIINDIERYKHIKGMTPTVLQLRKSSTNFRNIKPRNCPCYKQISAENFELWYYVSDNKLKTYESSKEEWR